MNKWFKDVKTIEELRKKYRELLKLYHPDNENGSVKITQEINAEYDHLFSVLRKNTQTSNLPLAIKMRKIRHLKRF